MKSSKLKHKPCSTFDWRALDDLICGDYSIFIEMRLSFGGFGYLFLQFTGFLINFGYFCNFLFFGIFSQPFVHFPFDSS